MSIAYALRADYEDIYTGGVVAVGADRTVDINAELENGDGQIVVSENDDLLLSVLDNYVALKRVTADSDEPTVTQYGDMNVSDLRREAKNLGLTPAGNSREALLAALQGTQAASGQEA